jgi:hypothetical protein
VFDDPARAAWQKPAELVAALALRPGQAVADVGAGTGYFLTHLAGAVGETGTVYAVETEPNLVVHLRDRADRDGQGNVGPGTPHWHIHPTRRAGTPTIKAYAGTSLRTTAPAPMKQYSPRVTPQTMVAFAPIELPRRTRVERYSDFRGTWLRGLETLVKTQLGPQKTSSSSTTPS